MVVVKSVVVVTPFVTCSCRAVVVAVMAVGIVVTTAAGWPGWSEPDREAATTKLDTGAIVVAVSVSIVEEHSSTVGVTIERVGTTIEVVEDSALRLS